MSHATSILEADGQHSQQGSHTAALVRRIICGGCALLACHTICQLDVIITDQCQQQQAAPQHAIVTILQWHGLIHSACQQAVMDKRLESRLQSSAVLQHDRDC